MLARFASILILAMGCAAFAQAQTVPAPAAGEKPFEIRLEPLPDVTIADQDSGIPPVSHVSPVTDIALPGLPDIGIPGVEIERGERRLGESALAVAPDQPAQTATAAPDVTIGNPLAPPDLPQPDNPSAHIAMMPDRPAAKVDPAPRDTASVPVPAAKPAAQPIPAQPLPAASSPAPANDLFAQDQLVKELLDRAIGELADLQPQLRGQAQAIRDFYETRNHTAVWTTSAGLNPKAQALVSLARRADEHGLDPGRFRSLIDAMTARDSSREKQEAAVSVIAVLYARDARGGRINPLTVSRLITSPLTLPETSLVLAALASAANPAVALEAYNPTHPGYSTLRSKLAELRTATPAAPVAPRLTFGKMLTVGMSDARVPLLREMLGVPASDTEVFDAALSVAVRNIQRERGLKINGRLDRATTAALGGVDQDAGANRNPAADIIANMERWRWLPTQLGEDHVFVNIPDFSLVFMRNGVADLKTRVIVGKTETQTPVFSHRMQFLVINPYWNVPPSIALKEMLPQLQKNPYALQAKGLEVVSRGKVVDPATVDWSAVGRTVAIRQPPGERNALGHVKFMFPNEHAVYLHDTPSRGLFVNERRAFSHGCVRVQDPFRLAEAVMGAGWSSGRLRSMVGGPERQVKLPAELPVHLAYFTTFVDDAGSLQTREDLYGHNRKVKALLGL